MKISAVVLTKNEESKIASCMKSLDFCNEIVVIDDDSIDKTREVAKELGAKVFPHKLNGNFSQQLNFGMDKANGDWVIFVDPDEKIPDVLKSEILSETKRAKKGINGFCIKRIDFMWGRWLKHGESGATELIRLVRRGSGRWKRRVHQYFDIQEGIQELKNPLLHYPHPTLTEFIRNINTWTSWHALANIEEGKTSSLLKIIFWPIGHFIKNYIIRGGFLDGMQGFVYATIMSAHSFLSWSKLWLLQRKNSQ